MVKLLVAGTLLIKRSKFSTDDIKVSTLYWILNVKYHFSINGWNIEIKIWRNLCLISTEGIETKNSLCSLDSNWAEFSFMRSIMALSGWRTETNVRHVSHGILLRTRVTCSPAHHRLLSQVWWWTSSAASSTPTSSTSSGRAPGGGSPWRPGRRSHTTSAPSGPGTSSSGGCLNVWILY